MVFPKFPKWLLCAKNLLTKLYVFTCSYVIRTYIVQGATDADEEAEKCGRKEPFILIVETDESFEYIVYVEKEYLVSTKSLVDAVADVICAYFVFDLVYTKNIYPLLIFLQHTMMGIQDVKKLPTSVMTLLSSLSSEP